MKNAPTSADKKLFLLDAYALIFRAYYAFSKNPRINSEGFNTSAIFGFANTLFEVLSKENPTHIGIAFDLAGPTERKVEYTAYKANREETPEDIIASIPYVFALAEALNIPVLMADGYEADDVIGTLARKAEAEGFLTYMMTSDKDFGQLVTDNIWIYRPGRGGEGPEKIGPAKVCQRYGIQRPEQLIDILGLWGDAVDNIPGVPGVGEKTAIKLIAEFGSMESVLENTDKLKGKLKENLENFSEQALMSKRLATIIMDTPVDFDAAALERKDPDLTKLRALFEKLEFRRLINKLLPPDAQEAELQKSGKAEKPGQTNMFESSGVDIQTEPVEVKMTILDNPHEYNIAETQKERSALLKLLQKHKVVCFDTETTGTDPNQAEMVGMSFSVEKGKAWYVPLPENYHESLLIVKEFAAFFENPKIAKVGQNLKFDIAILKWYETEVIGRLCDTMLAHYLLQPELRHNMDFMAETWLGYSPVSIETLIGKKGALQGSMRDVALKDAAEYACEDADITLQLWNLFEPELKNAQLLKLYDDVEAPLIHVLADMEAIGINLDTDALNKYADVLGIEVQEVAKQIIEYAGVEFNISSPKQLGEILFEKLKIIDKPRKTKTGQYATGEEVLEQLRERHPIIVEILDYRQLTKLKSTYVDVLPDMLNPRTRRIHSSFNQAVTSTGRLSSNNPNLQNIPIRTARGREIRKAFIPRNKNYVLISADYSQIELRVMAHLSGDTGMQDAFRSGHDIHTATAARVYGILLEGVTPQLRQTAKMVNFGIIYGISAFGLSQRLGIPRKEADEIINQYFTQYPGVKAYMESQINHAREYGYVETILKRRRYLKKILSGNSNERSGAEREAINAPVQGSAADMIKVAMIRIHEALEAGGFKTRMLLQVHDELVFDAPKNEVEAVISLIREKMQNALPLDVPVEVDIREAGNWLDAH
ncbi:MAG: DNA polymerase I [Bacteroidetes bacterium]|nr:DNA polymerase I [Bacteroidota bacterium]MBU1717888.1 DNA polymerase I [Bacteroidota bacterium]